MTLSFLKAYFQLYKVSQSCRNDFSEGDYIKIILPILNFYTAPLALEYQS